eukprot:CAMPEP_0174316216 /NCGR_PEP_ID=MMETSP0810-20121108/6783_1 /TAXON_ID=73025 ORGANISM="Eutreptiella gymnastica-like, Strain CCMP1594" /NCGR_SAMPLE_ID=MMETSP0810 /ASSEMBLY_ACC=CAM_ASM_000659 /LENGTH=461 /DNA_ID=CAMNT_0015425817 /DNA_START=46 /DNA_END=1431 /DNA_ORIENTATION=-
MPFGTQCQLAFISIFAVVGLGVSFFGLVMYCTAVAAHQRSAASVVLANTAVEVPCQADALHEGQFVFLSCEVVTIPTLTEAPAFRPVQALMTPRNDVLFWHADVSVWGWQLGKVKKNHYICEEGWTYPSRRLCEDRPGPPPPFPGNLRNGLLVAAAFSVEIGARGGPGQGYRLANPLRDQLMRRLWVQDATVPDVFTGKVEQSSSYDPFGNPTLKASDWCAQKAEGDTVYSSRACVQPMPGDVKFTAKAFPVNKVSVFARQARGVPQEDVGRSKCPRESHNGLVGERVGMFCIEQDANLMPERIEVWPQMSGQEERPVLQLSSDGYGHALLGPLTKAEAIRQLEAEQSSAFTRAMIACLLIGVFMSVWNGALLFCFAERLDGQMQTCEAKWRLCVLGMLGGGFGLAIFVAVVSGISFALPGTFLVLGICLAAVGAMAVGVLVRMRGRRGASRAPGMEAAAL